MRILKVQILEMKRGGADEVSLFTDFPSPIIAYPESCLVLNFKVSRGMGRSYVDENFQGVPIEVIRIG